MKDFKIRASAAGQIMKSARSGNSMSETAKSYIEQWLKEQLYNRTKQFSNKYTEKGLLVESDAIKYLSELRGENYIKNVLYFDSEHFIGTPDIITKDAVIDIKCSWDCFTFPLFDLELPNNDYYYQMQVYMDLTNTNSAEVVYLLMDAPDDIIDREALLEARRLRLEEIEMDLFDQVKDRMTYTGLDDSLRVKSFKIERNDAVIQKIKDRVEECRQYINLKQIAIWS